MKRKVFIYFLIFVLLINNQSIYIHADEIDTTVYPTDMVDTYAVYREFMPKYDRYLLKDFDVEYWNKHQLLVLKTDLSKIIEPPEYGGDINNESKGEWRYIGETPYGQLVNNPDYPDDVSGKAIINSYSWIKNEDRKSRFELFYSREEAYEIIELAFDALEVEYKERFIRPTDEADINMWRERAMLIVPPCYHGTGIIRFCHLWDSDKDGKVERWYITAMIEPNTSLTKAYSGTEYEATCNIDVPTSVPEDTTSVTGTFDFNLRARSGRYVLDAWSVVSSDSNVHIAESDSKGLVPMLNNTNYTGSIPISIDLPTDTTTIDLTVYGFDELGYPFSASQSVTINKDGAAGSLSSIDLMSSINIPTSVADSVTTVTGTYDFNIETTGAHIASYTLINNDANVTISGTMADTFAPGMTNYTGSVPIQVNLPTDPTDIELSVQVTDSLGHSKTHRAKASVNKTSSLSSGSLDAQASGIIAADDRGSEDYDVSQGIPTSEDLYVNVQAKEYLHEENFINVSDSITYRVTVNKTYKLWRWDKKDKRVDTDGDGVKDDWEAGWDSKTEDVSITYDVVRSYDFYMIDQLSVFALENATVNNDALPGSSLTLNSSVVAPSVVMDRDTIEENHLKTPITGRELTIDLEEETLGKSKSNTDYPDVSGITFETEAEAAIGDIEVKNDGLIFNGTTLMDNGWYTSSAPSPSPIPDASLNDIDDLFEDDLTISDTVSNGSKYTDGTVNYQALLTTESDTSYRDTISGLDEVLIHTPVVCYPELNEISMETQLIKTDPSQIQLVIEESFHLDYPYEGQHSELRGYGDRDYQEYFDTKQVQFPFDVYVGSDYSGLFLPRDTWGNFNSEENTFFIPSWVEEVDGHILFRSIAENIPDIDDPAYNYSANTHISAYKAVEVIPVNVSGKVYDFTVTTCREDYWLKALEEGSLYAGSASKSYKEESYAKENTNRLLPLMPGKTYEDHGQTKTLEGLMLGYPIEFSIETNGQLYNDNDLIRIIPRYYYVEESGGSADMSTRQEVDLYVSDFSSLSLIEEDIYLSSQARTYIGDLSEKDTSISNESKEKSIQLWKGQFYLPNMTYAVPKGTDLYSLNALDLNKEPFLHDGYIIVNFEIEVYTNVTGLTTVATSDEIKLHLDKTDSTLIYGSGWNHESYQTSQLGLDLMEGDIIFYSTDKRASQTYY